MITSLLNVARRYGARVSLKSQAENTQIASRLASLPIELLTEVLKAAAWKEILRLRITCKLLYSVTKTRAIWAHLVGNYISSKPYPPRLERPIEMYTSAELEHLLLVWNSADMGWSKDDGVPARERILKSTEPIEFVHLIKGGRWLLVTTEMGAVTYYDLDADKIMGALLIPAQVHKPHARGKIRMAIDIDMDSPALSFKIGFFIIGIGNKAMFQVWGVSLVLDSSQNGVGLSASALAVFNCPPTFRDILEFTFLGPAIAFVALIPQRGIFTFVLEWTQVTEDPSKYYWRIFKSFTVSNSSLIQLLPGKRILITSGDYIHLFDYSRVEETLCIVQQNQLSPMLDSNWKLRIGRLFSGYMSMCFITPSAMQFNFVSNRHIHSMLFRAAQIPDEVPSLFHLADAPGNGFFVSNSFLGFSRSVAVDFDQYVWLVRYNFPDDGHPGVLDFVRKRLKSVFHVMCRCPAVDEDSGRVVVSDLSESNEVVIADFALIYTP